MNDSRRSPASSVPWRLASESRATHWVAVANCTRWPARQARIDRAIATRLLCLSREDAEGPRAAAGGAAGRGGSGGFEDAEQVAGDVALEATLDLARALAFGGA